jgi:hypothetical protein
LSVCFYRFLDVVPSLNFTKKDMFYLCHIAIIVNNQRPSWCISNTIIKRMVFALLMTMSCLGV